ncbi:alpha/beta hydrolase [Lewinella sp. W8]|uniref:alpha/beta hydrolase n=1 Tax=Lewinella sp. W8 TaxID=2528208 RepID=UPI001067BDA1|nr:alpha/beta hydrolase [Lewinella sp. W8]MTB51478.1 alpha/beta hydrolase fold domain-containing protein [Lewinella sp. W8]
MQHPSLHSLARLMILLLALGASAMSAQSTDTVGYREFRDLAYLEGGDSLQMLNLLVPETDKKPPLLLWLGGGAWAFVNRNVEMPLARKIAREGIAVASVGHRLSTGTWVEPERTEGVQHPAHAQDAAAAFHWLKEHAEAYGYDANNIYIGGYSCGAHLAAILGSDARFLEAHGYALSDIRGLLPIAGAYDIPAYHKVFAENENPDNRRLAELHVEAVFGPTEAQWKDASPTEYIEHLAAPMLLMSEIGLYNYTKIYEEAIRESSYRDVTVHHVLDLNHGGLWRDMSQNQRSHHRMAMVNFIRAKAVN